MILRNKPGGLTKCIASFNRHIDSVYAFRKRNYLFEIIILQITGWGRNRHTIYCHLSETRVTNDSPFEAKTAIAQLAAISRRDYREPRLLNSIRIFRCVGNRQCLRVCTSKRLNPQNKYILSLLQANIWQSESI